MRNKTIILMLAAGLLLMHPGCTGKPGEKGPEGQKVPESQRSPEVVKSPGASPAGSGDQVWWEDVPPAVQMDWLLAQEYCEKLESKGKSDWRLPTVSELRSLIRGCAATQKGGTCEAVDGCNRNDCRNQACDGCNNKEGPGKNGCYMDASSPGVCGKHWAYTPCADSPPDGAWTVNFANGNVSVSCKRETHYVRCLRGGP